MCWTVIVNGGAGKLGQVALSALEQSREFSVVGCLGRKDNLVDALKAKKADVVFDATSAEVAAENCAHIIEAGCRPVIGSSGISIDEFHRLKQLSCEHGVGGLVVPNFSLSAMIAIELSEAAARYFNHAEIVEYHGLGKADKPSGTAIETANRIKTYTGRTNIEMHSIRMNVFGARQDVHLANDWERLQITTDVVDGTAYQSGILFACRRVSEVSELQLGLGRLLGF